MNGLVENLNGEDSPEDTQQVHIESADSLCLEDTSGGQEDDDTRRRSSVLLGVSQLFGPSRVIDESDEFPESLSRQNSEDMFECQVDELPALEVVVRDDSFEIYEFVQEQPRTSTNTEAQSTPGNSSSVRVTRSGSGNNRTGFPRLGALGFGGQNEEPDETLELMVNKLRSVWNNVKFGWSVKIKPNFSETAPLYLLGRCYFPKAGDQKVTDANGQLYLANLDAFRQDFSSRLWFTYRTNFPALPLAAPSGGRSSVLPTVRTSDCGWGCMLRSGQMMLAQAFLFHFLKRGWNVDGKSSPAHNAFHRQIIRWFGDNPARTSPFSIHQLVRVSGKPPGEWFGPSTVCQLFQWALEEAKPLRPKLDELEIYMAADRVVYREDVMKLASGKSTETKETEEKVDTPSIGSSRQFDSGFGSLQTNGGDPSVQSPPWHAVIILIPLHLGGSDRVNQAYTPVLQRMLATEGCLGIIGGKPRHSVYFVGCQEDALIYMDPHYSQETVNVNRDEFPTESYHCCFPRKMSFKSMDPSCAAGFYCRTREELKRLLDTLARLTTPNQGYPLVEVCPGARPLHANSSDLCLRVHRVEDKSKKTETVNEYVFL